jgi:hypothetical protein
VVKMTFAKGAFLAEPSRLFNSSLDGNLRRAIDVQEGEAINAPALKALIRAAVELNVSGKRSTKRAATKAADETLKPPAKKTAKKTTKKASPKRAGR